MAEYKETQRKKPFIKANIHSMIDLLDIQYCTNICFVVLIPQFWYITLITGNINAAVIIRY